ncbi:hypothetical protein PAAG_00898 [Paracoccidioides lutzii Pb01]|uniref:Uncharacterized protein n=1 Tax=Paracoccidioides lutzii (strain ATCC MYA-826 / Pb01) TaxID=502779 RepID=C1GQV3_PARBA|nr:hypothetical protein PAAG_00898 [Paracoccidioides lutzii Pb01]EEH37977.1 hypothetical protein PAAG_00898 [Paracoccidioides lutzii Pb01]
MSWLYPFSGLNRSNSRGSTSSHRLQHSRDRHSTTSRHHRNSTTSSLFSIGGHANRSTPSIFSIGSQASSSSRRAKPRLGFVWRVLRKIRRLFRDILHYARRRPLKVFLLVIVPLITGGVLQKLLSVVGIRLPPSLGGGGGYKERNNVGGLNSVLGGGGGWGGVGDSVGGLVSLAKMFV